jgi:hypothetical protein
MFTGRGLCVQLQLPAVQAEFTLPTEWCGGGGIARLNESESASLGLFSAGVVLSYATVFPRILSPVWDHQTQILQSKQLFVLCNLLCFAHRKFILQLLDYTFKADFNLSVWPYCLLKGLSQEMIIFESVFTLMVFKFLNLSLFQRHMWF